LEGYIGLSRAFRYRFLVLPLITTIFTCKVSFLSVVITFNVLLILVLRGIKLYRAYMLFLLDWVVIIIPLFGIRPISLVTLERSRVNIIFFLSSFIEPVVKFNS
jgi:hypothetical protein